MSNLNLIVVVVGGNISKILFFEKLKEKNIYIHCMNKFFLAK